VSLHFNCRPRALLLLSMALVPLACSNSKEEPERPPLFPVEGKIYFSGKPAANAHVWLQPVESSKDPRPHGVVQADGTFKLSTYGKEDGAPAGAYRPTVIWTKPSKFKGDHEGESLLPPHYQDPKESGLPILVIKQERTILPPLLLEP
jgi:hypothetical protein